MMSSSSSRVFRACRVLMALTRAETKASKAPSSATATKPRPSRSAGILKTAPLSPALGKFLGVSEASRTDAVKKIWDYIKSHNLQNPVDKRVINCDEKLKTIFDGKGQVGFLEISKLLSQHFVKSQ